jgi:hypothetical protein
MTTEHLTMEQLLAVRDGERSEPALVAAHEHVAGCHQCRAELEGLHQRTARLKALATMEPARNQFPAIRARLADDRRHQWQRRFAIGGLAAAATLAISVVGYDLVRPQQLDASAQLETAMTRSQVLEQTLTAYRPESRVIDTRTAQVVIEIEDRIAAVDARLARVASLDRSKRLTEQVSLWQERVGLMSALVDVHFSKATNVDL